MKKPPVQIVNDKDEFIGLKDRLALDYATDIYRVSALWMTNSAGDVLIAQRKLTKDRDPGLWGPAVAGTIDEGETYDINIYKEAEEEIGLSGVEFQKGPKTHITSPRHYFCQWYRVTLDRPAASFTLQEDEVEAVVWMPLAKLREEVAAQPAKYIPTMERAMTALYGEA